MPIRAVIQDDGKFTPEESGVLLLAFDQALRKLGWVKATDTVAVVIAKEIVAHARRRGELDPNKLSASALSNLRLGPSGKS
jgi:hypothetical protein